ncbi:MAG: hypothetical protein ACKOI2_08410 [Actinomycetota bacterium]
MDGTLPPPRPPKYASKMRLTPGWSRTSFLAWGSLAIALACAGISSHIIGRPVFWLDDQRWPVGVLVLLAVCVAGPSFLCAFWSYLNGTWVPLISGASTAVLAVAALLDRHSSPGAAVVEGALAGAGLLMTFATFTGRYRVPRQE